MAFTTTATRDTGEAVETFNIDFQVGPGAWEGNRQADVMLVQALFHILYFELRDPRFPPPPGKTEIEVDGKVGRSTAAFIMNWQQQCRMQSLDVRLDGVLDPFRRQRELSHRSQTRYALELLNIFCSSISRAKGGTHHSDLPHREDMPAELTNALSSNRRDVALMYASESRFA